jgi:hypothetical protein
VRRTRFALRGTLHGARARRTRFARRGIPLAVAVVFGICVPASVPASAPAAPAASLSGSFIPERLGQRTTLDFAFSFSVPAGTVPPPLTQIELRYPNYLGIGLSGLGLATCSAETLEASGPVGCPPNSIMGYGGALTGIVLGSEIITESTPITILRTANQEGHFALLFYAEGTTPVTTRIVFPGLLLPASSPFGGLVSIGVPLVPTLPGAPYISVLKLRATLGPHKVTYFEQSNGRTLAYEPIGILLPNSCPRRGFPFDAQFSFLGGAVATARTAVPCPARAARRGVGGKRRG